MRLTLRQLDCACVPTQCCDPQLVTVEVVQMDTLLIAALSKRQNDYSRAGISEHSRVHKFNGPSHVEYVPSDEQPSQGCLLRRKKPAIPSSVRDDGQ
jgi:hypothetical protein